MQFEAVLPIHKGWSNRQSSRDRRRHWRGWNWFRFGGSDISSRRPRHRPPMPSTPELSSESFAGSEETMTAWRIIITCA